MGTVALYTLRSLNSAHIWQMTLFPTIFAQKNPRVHVCSMNSHDEAANIESSINDSFCFQSVLYVPYVDLDNGHVQFGRKLDNFWFQC